MLNCESGGITCSMMDDTYFLRKSKIAIRENENTYTRFTSRFKVMRSDETTRRSSGDCLFLARDRIQSITI